MAQFIGTSMPRGFAGELTRAYYTNLVETKLNDKAAPVVAFGFPVKVNDAKNAITPCKSAEDAGKVYGFSVRFYGQAQTSDQHPTEGAPIGVLRKGYVAVKCKGGTPVLGDKVYLTAKGEVTAEAAGTAIEGAQFMGAVDADGLAEISFNI